MSENAHHFGWEPLKCGRLRNAAAIQAPFGPIMGPRSASIVGGVVRILFHGPGNEAGMKQMHRFLLSTFFLIAACGQDSDAGGDGNSAACRAGIDAASCQSSDELKACAQDLWQYVDCDVACQQAGLSALGCGADPDSGEASCLCGGPGVVTGGGGNDDGGNNCEPVDAPCEVNGDCCDAGDVLCVNDGTSSTCLKACASDGECSSGCCVDLEGGGGACAASAYCGSSCSDDFGPCEKQGECCGYPTGEAFCVDDGDGGTCHPSCDVNSDCGSSCCAELESGDSVCAPSEVCGDDNPPPSMCHDPGESCAVNGDCCDYDLDLAYCVNYGDNNVVCAAACFSGDDCFSGCCATLQDGSGACSAPEFCASVEPGFESFVSAKPQSKGTTHRRDVDGGRLSYRVTADGRR